MLEASVPNSSGFASTARPRAVVRMAKPHDAARRRAFSLIEMTIVVVIIGVVVAVAVPRFANSLSTQRADAAARAVAADVQRAVDMARSTSAPVTIVFDTDHDTYQVAGMTLADQGGGSDRRNLAAEFPGVSLAICDFGGSSTLTIDGFGSPTSSGEIVLKKNDEVRTLLFDRSTGQVDVIRGIPGHAVSASSGGGSGGSGSGGSGGGSSGGDDEDEDGLVVRILNLLGL